MLKLIWDCNNENSLILKNEIITIRNYYIYYTQNWKQKNSKAIKRSWWTNKVINNKIISRAASRSSYSQTVNC